MKTYTREEMYGLLHQLKNIRLHGQPVFTVALDTVTSSVYHRITLDNGITTGVLEFLQGKENPAEEEEENL